MSELRFNRITGDWVIIAKERTFRPEEFVAKGNTSDPPTRQSDCPFCPGNEAESETIASTERGPSWGVRLVRNKFPALASLSDFQRKPFVFNKGSFHPETVNTVL